MSVTILIVDDHNIVRDGLRALLEPLAGMKVVGEAENGRVAVRLAREIQPDIVIIDVAMPDLNGIEATRKIRSQVPGTKVIGLSMHSDRRFVSRMLQAGAAAYLRKESAFEEIAAAIEAVARGEHYLGRGITDLVVADYKALMLDKSLDRQEPLTHREREVVQLLAEGKKTAEIATQLHVSVKTVETHRTNIMGKLGLHSIAELTKYAVREGLTSLDD